MADLIDERTPERKRLDAWSADNPRDERALVAIAAWLNTTPDKLPKEMRFHTCAATKEAWARVADTIAALPAQGVPEIEERKFYHDAWPLTKLLEARDLGNGLLTDDGEAWRYRLTHSDARGKYDVLYRPTRKIAALEPASGGVPAWLSNCVVCGRIVDTREKDEGGDGHGCEYKEGWTCSSECAEKLHPDPDWMKAELATPAHVATDRVEALVKAAEAMVKRGVVNQDECGGCVECGSTGVNGGDYGYAGEADEDHEPDCPYIMLRAALAAYRGDAK